MVTTQNRLTLAGLAAITLYIVQRTIVLAVGPAVDPRVVDHLGNPRHWFYTVTSTAFWCMAAIPGIAIWWLAHRFNYRSWVAAVVVSLLSPTAILYFLEGYADSTGPNGEDLRLFQWVWLVDTAMTPLIALIMWRIAYRLQTPAELAASSGVAPT